MGTEVKYNHKFIMRPGGADSVKSRKYNATVIRWSPAANRILVLHCTFGDQQPQSGPNWRTPLYTWTVLNSVILYTHTHTKTGKTGSRLQTNIVLINTTK